MPEPSWPAQELGELARATAVLLGASQVWLALLDRHGNIVPRIAVTADRGAPIASDPSNQQTFTARVISLLLARNSLDPLVIGDLRQQPDLLRSVNPDVSVIQSLAAVALVSEGKMIGALIVTRAQSAAFSDVIRQPLNMLASMVMAAIRLTSNAERNAAQASELSALLNAARALTNSLDSRQVFRAIIESIQGVIRCDSALIYRYDERSKQLRVIAGMGERPDALEGSLIALNDASSKAAWVARERHHYVGVVRPEDEIGAHTDALALRPGATFSLLCMPLVSKGRLRGVASLARRYAFTTPEVGALERLSPIAAAALENVEMFHQSQAARQQQEALFASASDGFALIDDGRRFAQVNPAFARYMATDPADVLGQICCKSFSVASDGAPHGPDSCRLCHGEPECLLYQVMRTGASRDHVECIFPPREPMLISEPTLGAQAARVSAGPESMARTIDFSLTPIVGSDQRPRLLLVGRDVSGPREMQRLRAEQIQLISHEMAGPLHSISANIDYFLRYNGHTISREQIAMLDTARATALSMTTLVDDLDLISRRDAGEWRIDLQPTDITEEALNAAAEMEIIAQQQNIILRTDMEPRVPLALADRARVRQVARNLIINAIKFTRKGGRVQVTVRSDASWVAIQVEDTGVGIPDNELPLIWTRYYQSPHTGSVRASGRGLGLAIVRIIMEEHHGQKDVRSEVGRGTVFIVRFPRADRGGRG
jgi:signal transduction histidine kinase/GAF domain-containing protein